MQRLKTRAQFQAVLAGAAVARSAHFALHRLLVDAHGGRDAGHAGDRAAACGAAQAGPDGRLPPGRAPQPLFAAPGLWLGVLLPKRAARRAVTRNAIRRQIYAVAALFASALVPADPGSAGAARAAHAAEATAAGHASAAQCTVAYVVRLRAGFERKQFVSARSAALRLAVRAELLQLFAHAARRAAARGAAAPAPAAAAQPAPPAAAAARP